MKITAIRPVVVHAGDRNWIFVRVETDQPGLYGWGEATPEWKTRAVVGCIEDFVPMLTGRDPRDIPWLHERMIKHSFWPLGVIGLTAVSAIEQALWDILGKDAASRCGNCSAAGRASGCGSTRISPARSTTCGGIRSTPRRTRTARGRWWKRATTR